VNKKIWIGYSKYGNFFLQNLGPKLAGVRVRGASKKLGPLTYFFNH